MARKPKITPAVPQGAPYTPGAQVPMVRTPGGTMLGRSPLQARATDAVFREIPQARLGAPTPRPQIGYTPTPVAPGPAVSTLNGKSFTPFMQRMGGMRGLMARGGAVSTAMIPIEMAASATADQAQKSGQAIPTQIASQTTNANANTSWNAPKSTMNTSYTNPFTGAPVTKVTNTDFSTVGGEKPAERPYTPALVPENLREKQDVASTSAYGARYDGGDYALGTEGTQNALEKAKGPLTLYGKGEPITEEQRLAQAAEDMKRITDHTTMLKASRLADEAEGESRQAALDKGLAAARASNPWYSGGTPQGRLAGALQLQTIMEKEKQNAAIKQAAAQAQAKEDSPAMEAAKINKYNAEAKQALADAASKPTKAELAKQGMYEKRLAVYSKMLQEAEKLPTEEDKNAAKEQAEAFLNDMERYKSGTKPAVKGFLGLTEKEPAKDIYGYRPRLQGKEKAMWDEIFKGA